MNTENKSKNITYLAVGLFTVAVAGLGIVGYNYIQRDNKQSSNAQTSSADGAYTATGNYRTPGGNQDVGVSLVLKNGLIESLTVTNKATDPESREYQEKFIGGVGSIIKGKKIEDVNVSRVSGSSLTGAGFNQALEKIKEQAKQ